MHRLLLLTLTLVLSVSVVGATTHAQESTPPEQASSSATRRQDLLKRYMEQKKARALEQKTPEATPSARSSSGDARKRLETARRMHEQTRSELEQETTSFARQKNYLRAALMVMIRQLDTAIERVTLKELPIPNHMTNTKTMLEGFLVQLEETNDVSELPGLKESVIPVWKEYQTEQAEWLASQQQAQVNDLITTLTAYQTALNEKMSQGTLTEQQKKALTAQQERLSQALSKLTLLTTSTDTATQKNDTLKRILGELKTRGDTQK